MKAAALSFALLLGAAAAEAQSSDDTPQANPARPTVATPATLTPVGYVQFETGALGARTSPEFDSRFSLNEVVKLAVHSRLQLLLLAEPYIRYRTAGTTTQTGGDIFLGFQTVMHHGEGTRPTLAASYIRHLRAGSAPDIDLGTAEDSAQLLASADVRGFHYDANAMFNRVRNGALNRLQLGQTISIAHPLGHGFGLAGELWHFTQPLTHGHAAGNLWTVSYAARRNLVFDAGFNRGLTSTSTRWEVFGGFTYLLPKKLWR